MTARAGIRGSDPLPSDPSPREMCYRCFRPPALCYCAELVPVSNTTPVIILQHPREQWHPLGTVRILRESLQQVQVLVDWDHGLRRGTRPLELPVGAGLLFPSPGARDLACLSPDEFPASLVVLDGTWTQAKALYRDIPGLRSLPHFAFAPDQPSRYRVRREPRQHYVSTVEATVHALLQIEPETPGLDRILRVFERMIDLHIEAREASPHQPRSRRRRPPILRSLPKPLVDGFDRVVIAHGETLPVKAKELRTRCDRRDEKMLVHWAARRPRDGACFSAFITPTRIPAELELRSLGIEADQLAEGGSLEQVRQAWLDFVGKDDVCLVWNHNAQRILLDFVPAAESIALRQAFSNFRRRINPSAGTRGPLDEILSREGVVPAPASLPGRAGQRIAQIEALARRINECALELREQGPAQLDHSAR
jgi:DTW domain-containing protein YfiP